MITLASFAKATKFSSGIMCAVHCGVFSTLGTIRSILGGGLSTFGGYLEHTGGDHRVYCRCSVHWGAIMMPCGAILSTLEVTQYIGGKLENIVLNDAPS